ncbi:class I SAM-dependent methyltransferase [uncultured Rhodoblastus sp.]|uniref:class I SAM-dependent methyltransferase n=1 Tax=uncultured Rhodoblastus sp. TaxID=543037 RepID=UPI0025E37AC8|nr:class I SAM-dependent methyltransferase [uncultured Rhodoblastus sp.]
MTFHHFYGAPPPELADIAADARQFSPLRPASGDLEAIAPGALPDLVMFAPPGAIERRRALALALRALAPGAPFLVMAPKDKGGGRLARELAELGCPAHETAKRHHRICAAAATGDPKALDAAITAGAPRFSELLGLWTQPGVFAWDRIDKGTALLLRHLPEFAGRGADFGCGLGLLGHAILRSGRVKNLTLVDSDRRAVALCRHNVADARANIVWADARDLQGLEPLDFVAMNPPFHEGGAESRSLGLAFIDKAATVLRKGGQCWLVANRHLPYEAALARSFREVRAVAEEGGYKIVEARK